MPGTGGKKDSICNIKNHCIILLLPYRLTKLQIMETESLNELVHELADMISSDNICFVNPETMEWINIPKTIYYGGDGKEDYQDDLDTVDMEWKSFVRIDPPEATESFTIMEDFVNEEVPEGKFKMQLINALNRDKPFRNFNFLIHSSDYRKQWFAFKMTSLEKKVRRELKLDDRYPGVK